MPSAWADTVEAERATSATAPPRSTYVPPHLRNRPPASSGEAPPFAQAQSSSFGYGSGAGTGSGNYNRGGRGLGRTYSNGSSEFGGSGSGWGGSRRFEKEADPFANEVETENTGLNFDAYEDIPVQATGENVPNHVNSFAEIDFGNALNENVRRCKFAKPTPVQKHAIPISLAGRDLMACAQTGSGKTLAFCFPIISGVLRCPPSGRPKGTRQALPLALILSPTRELCIQIHEQARKFAYQTGLKVLVVYGGTPIRNQLLELERGVDILVATPGRLEDIMERGKIGLSMVRYLALDEADRMLDMGFEPQIRRIVDSSDLPPPGMRQTMLFSATFPREIQRLASDFLHNYIFLAVGRVGSSTDLIVQRVEYVREHEKRSMLIDLIHGQNLSSKNGQVPLTLVFVETKRGADALEDCLVREGFAATTIHGDRSQQDRELALRSFKTGRTPVLVATDVAARGLDIPHVAHVINYDLPNDIDDYVHRIGRTGRAGKSGIATAFFTDKDMSLAKPLAELMQESNQAVPEWLSNCAAKSGFGGRSGRSGSRFGGRDYRRGRGGPRGDSFGSGGYGGGYGGSSGGGGYHGSSAWEE